MREERKSDRTLDKLEIAREENRQMRRERVAFAKANPHLGRKPREPRTHCKFGHEFTPENTYTPPCGLYRLCKKCRAARSRETREDKKS